MANNARGRQFANLYPNEEMQNFPAIPPVPQGSWYHALWATLCLQSDEIHRLWRGPFFAFFDGKLEAIFRCLCLPCVALVRAVNEQHQHVHFKQSGVVYLFLYLSITVVVNLVVPILKVIDDTKVTNDMMNIQGYVVLGSMVFAIAEMFYLWLFTLRTLEYREWNLHAGYPPEALMRVFYQGGIYLFGFVSVGYSVCMAADYIDCNNILIATVNITKAGYIVVQTLFLSLFYKARIPDNTSFIQIVLAHLLGTNLALWFWALCSEEVSRPSKCISHPFPLEDTEKYFSPLFVEYSLIAASLFYQIWKDLLPMQGHRAAQNNAINPQANQRLNGRRGGGAAAVRAAISRSLGLGIFIGCCFGVMFLVLVVVSHINGEDRQVYHVAYSGGIISLFLTQIFACYIILLSIQPLVSDAERNSIDHDDTLLYISLVGSLLWVGFHIYNLVLIDLDPNHIDSPIPDSDVRVLDIATDVLAMLQFVFQATTLVILRRHKPTQGRPTTWICQCVLFLFITNVGLWIENSFFIEIEITTPGEIHTSIHRHLKAVGYVVHPLVIFFRFHSAVCCLIAWSIFRT